MQANRPRTDPARRGFTFQDIPVVKPPDPALQAKWALDVYYSAIQHQLGHDGASGSGDPEWRAIWGKETGLPANPPVPPDFSSSERPYDTDYRVLKANDEKGYYIPKYHRRPGMKSDVRVLYCVTLVEAALQMFPKERRRLMFCYLGTKYPRRGNFQPWLVKDYGKFVDSARAFVESSVDLGVFAEVGAETEAKAASRIRSMERRFMDVLEGEIARGVASGAKSVLSSEG